MILSPRLWWRKRQLRNEPVPSGGRPLSDTEVLQLAVAAHALADKEGRRRVALDEEGAELIAADKNGGGWW